MINHIFSEMPVYISLINVDFSKETWITNCSALSLALQIQSTAFQSSFHLGENYWGLFLFNISNGQDRRGVLVLWFVLVFF